MGKTGSGKSRHARTYRRISPRVDERSFQVVVEQSDLWITVGAGCPDSVRAIALDCLNRLRGEISARISLDPAFAASLIPVPVPEHGPEIIRRMCAAAAIMGVGPMACVAGGIAALTAEALLPFSAECLVENGGDTMLHSTRDRTVALLADPGKSSRLGLRIPAAEFPLSLCASSAVIGHSLSLGSGELAVVRSKDAFLADAAATALCNMLHGPDDPEKAADRARELEGEGIEGVFLQCAGRIAVWGNMELTAL